MKPPPSTTQPAPVRVPACARSELSMTWPFDAASAAIGHRTEPGLLQNRDVLRRIPQPACAEDQRFFGPGRIPQGAPVGNRIGRRKRPIDGAKCTENRLCRCSYGVGRSKTSPYRQIVPQPRVRRPTTIHGSVPRVDTGMPHRQHRRVERQGRMHSQGCAQCPATSATPVLEKIPTAGLDVRPGSSIHSSLYAVSKRCTLLRRAICALLIGAEPRAHRHQRHFNPVRRQCLDQFEPHKPTPPQRVGPSSARGGPKVLGGIGRFSVHGPCL